MQAFPDDVEAALTRAIGSYLRATPPQELPASLRRYQSFRPKALTAHRRTLLDALDDNGFRAHVGKWLEDKPNVDKREAELLGIAVERKDGWEEELSSRATERPSKSDPSGPNVDALVAKERERTLKAREEARRAREEMGAVVKELEAEIRRLRSEVTSLEKRLNTAEVRAGAADAEAKKARTALEREQRKARSAVEKAQAAAERARDELKETRRSLNDVTKELARAKVKPTPKPAKKKKPEPTGPRKPLPVPKGRLEDAPETLEAWLANEAVQLVVDGYNASMSGFSNLALEEQRARLVDELVNLARRTSTPATIVFDGADVSAAPKRSRGRVKVQYSAPDEIADDHVIALLETMPPHPVIVVTNDRELQSRARALGATIATSDQLLKVLR